MDDETLGMGGTIVKHINNGDHVHVCFIAHRIYNREFDPGINDREKKCALQAKKMLGYKEIEFINLNDERLDAAVQDIIIPLEKYVNKIKPDIVYIPFRGDNHQDHRAVFDAARVVLRSLATPFVKSIYMYEVPSSTDQSPQLPESSFMPNYYVNIKSSIEKKIKAYRCYKAEKRKFPNPRSEQALRILAQKRGVEAGMEYAEAYMLLRNRWE